MIKFKVIYMSYDGMTDPLGQSQVLPYLIGLSKLDIEIHLISFEKPQRFAAKSADINGIIEHTNIKWHPLIYHQSPPVLSTLYDIRQLKKKANQIIKENQISIIHCRSYITSLIGLFYKMNKGIPFIFDMRGFWADERVDGKIWSLSNPIYKVIYNYFKNKEKQFIKESSYVVSLTSNAKKEILSWHQNGLVQPKIKVIPCCADLAHFSINAINPSQVNHFRKLLNISENDFVVSYIGSLGTWYMIDEMMDFYKVLLNFIPQSKFLIVTADNPEIAMEAAAKIDISTNNIIIKKAERSEVPYLIFLSKFSVFFIKPAYSKKASSPTKLAEILGMGVPVICNANVGDVESIVEAGNVGFVINDFNNAQYEKAITKIINQLPFDANMIAQYANKYASLADGVQKYHEVYKDVLLSNYGDKTPL